MFKRRLKTALFNCAFKCALKSDFASSSYSQRPSASEPHGAILLYLFIYYYDPPLPSMVDAQAKKTLSLAEVSAVKLVGIGELIVADC